MNLTKSASLVLQAEQTRSARFTESLESFAALGKSLTTDSEAVELLLAYRPWARALDEANRHITVCPDEISVATEAYNEVAQHLLDKLHWPNEAISILPQGSASTQTLIRSPVGGEKFDIDAVCQIDISRVDARDPMGLFKTVGDALVELQAEAKRRCWHIPYVGRPFYLEFTPSVPLENVPRPTLGSMTPRYMAAPEYRATALAVVDTPTAWWKTSNPEGMSSWVNNTAERQLIRQMILKAATLDYAAEGIEPIPHQEVEITDTLRVAIRLFKRHRDMCVRRGIIAGEAKPISIIIVTLLTGCYEGLADLGRTYNHPVELLDELASFMPHLVLERDGKYWIDNPTVEGENFAEKWNDDSGSRHRAFMAWCQTLSADLGSILRETDEEAVSERVREVFGIPAPQGGDRGFGVAGYPPPPPPKPGRGLA